MYAKRYEVGSAGEVTRRQPCTALLSTPYIVLYRDCEVSCWAPVVSPDSDRFWITFDIIVGVGTEVIAPSKPARALHAWNKARWDEFRPISDKLISHRTKRSVKGVGALDEAVTRGIRQASKRKRRKGKGVVPPFWILELTKLDVMVQQCRNERKRDALIRWRRKVLADTAIR
ncbi:unnamed protein product [Trypanosoma congolense IL3000]|uniref:WGS project CAEQ00000000 data, annotated contig 144 n=1 Tax=Trypanosoma congolense (strain IL3000) TaxID=1068625 RepID=F9W6D1_TRYCI|nr:unnamed protein product [Trypanosoma congolense IL3000]